MKLRLLKKIHETTAIWSFRFEPLEPLSWQAGQSIRLELPRKTWGYTERRFTISSAAHEPYLQITTRISSSDFKQALISLETGTIIDGYNIEGKLQWGNPDQSKLFVAGGTGITLFRVALADAYHAGRNPAVTLFYSAKDSPLLFEHELRAWQDQGKNLTLHTKPSRFTAQEILNTTPTASNSLIHIAGPQAMVDDLWQQFHAAGLPETQLVSSFLG